MKEKVGKTKFAHGVSEANANEILHLLPRGRTVSNYQTTAWMTGLRGDRDKRYTSFLKTLKETEKKVTAMKN